VPSAAFDAVPGLVGFVAGSSIERVEVHRPSKQRRGPSRSCRSEHSSATYGPVVQRALKLAIRRHRDNTNLPFSSEIKAHTGFEPVFPENAYEPSERGEPGRRDVSELPADLQRIVERLTRAARAGRRDSAE
jgi:hypothetical protein